MKTREFWKFFVALVIYFIKCLVLCYSLSWEAPWVAGVTVSKYSPENGTPQQLFTGK